MSIARIIRKFLVSPEHRWRPDPADRRFVGLDPLEPRLLLSALPPVAEAPVEDREELELPAVIASRTSAAVDAHERAGADHTLQSDPWAGGPLERSFIGRDPWLSGSGDHYDFDPITTAEDSAPVTADTQVIEFDDHTRTQRVLEPGEDRVHQELAAIDRALHENGFEGIAGFTELMHGHHDHNHNEHEHTHEADDDGVAPMNIFEPDDRVQIDKVGGVSTEYPWRAMTRLWMDTAGGESFCSGSMISPFHVLTAGHCLHEGDGGDWHDTIRVIPGEDGDERLTEDGDFLRRSDDQPWGIANSQFRRTYTGWTEGGNFEWDIGLVTLDRNIGNYTGWLGFGFNDDDSWYEGRTANTAGYPGDLNNAASAHNMWYTYGDAASYDVTDHIFYTDEIDVWGGQSGSPAYYFQDDDRITHSVITHRQGSPWDVPPGDGDWNGLTRINSTKFSDLQDWRDTDFDERAPTDRADLVDYDAWFNTDFAFASDDAFTVGDPIEVTAYARNNGTTTAGAHSVRFRLSPDPEYAVGDPILGDVSMSSLSPFTLQSIDLSTTVPDVDPGEYYITWRIDPFGAVSEYSSTHNFGAMAEPVTISEATAPADIQLVSIDHPNEIDITDDLEVTYTLENVGGQTGTESFVDLMVSGTSQTYDDTHTSVSVEPGQTVTDTLVFDGVADHFAEGDTIEFVVALWDFDGSLSGTTDVGTLEPGEIHGFKWHDLDGDGVWDIDEPPLEGWEIYLDLDNTGQIDSGDPVAVTAADGSFSFTDLDPGTYTVAEVIPDGWKQTYPGFGESGMVLTTEPRDRAELGRELAAGLTTTAREGDYDTLHGANVVEIGEPLDMAPLMDRSTPLINLDAFRADPRFDGIDGSGFAVAVLDTGIQLDHPHFGPDTNGDGVADRIVHHYDFYYDNADATDFNGHGTHVTGTIASSDSLLPGVAPGVDIIHLKVFPDESPFLAPVSVQEAALKWVVDNTAEYNIAAINMSLGSGNYQTAQTHDHARRDEFAALADLNVLTVSSSGNSFYTYDSEPGVGMPSADPDVISVGSVWTDDFGQVNWSNGAIDYESGPDHVVSHSQRHGELTDTLAPGAFIEAAYLDSGTALLGGTSMASPHVAGAAVLAQQLAQQELGRTLDVDEFRDLLSETGVIVNDGDVEDDNVDNTNLDFPRLDMLALGEAILDLAPADGTHVVTVGVGEVIDNVNFGNRLIDAAADIQLVSIDHPDQIEINDNLEVTYTIENVGGETGTVDFIDLLVDGTGVTHDDTHSNVTVSAGQTVSDTLVFDDVNEHFSPGDTISFTVALDDPDHTGSLSGSTDVTTEPPTVSVAAQDPAPVEGEPIVLDVLAQSEGGEIEQVELFWEDGDVQSVTWDTGDDDLPAATFERSHDIGAYALGQELEFWATAIDNAGNEATSDIGSILVGPDGPLVVSSLDDAVDGDYGPGELTLREAVELANAFPGANVIQFHDDLTGGVTDLDPMLGTLQITSDMDILGPGADELTLDANELQDIAILKIDSGTSVVIDGLSFVGGGGYAADPAISNAGELALTDTSHTAHWEYAIRNSGVLNMQASELSDGIAGVSNLGVAHISDSSITGHSWAWNGGGIQNSGQLTLENTTVSDNIADGGGGLDNFGTAELIGVTFSNNQIAWGDGGAINNRGKMTIKDSSFSGNSTGGSVGAGGAIYNTDDLTVENTSFNGNEARTAGHAVYNSGTFHAHAIDVSGNGDLEGAPGTIRNAGDAVIRASKVMSNHGGWAGGGVHNTGDMVIADTTIASNLVATYADITDRGGAGVYNSGDLAIVNTTISNNTTIFMFDGGGAGILSTGGDLSLTQVTVTNNTAIEGVAGGVLVTGGTATSHNSIIADNEAEESSEQPDVGGDFDTDSAYNLVGVIDGSSGLDGDGAQYGTAAAPLDPMLGPLADNGGPTSTHLPLAGSPVIDAGSNALALDEQGDPLLTDQRGEARIQDGVGDGTAIVDLGAVELQEPATLPAIDAMLVSSSQWSEGFLDHLDDEFGHRGYVVGDGEAQLDPLPWPGIDQVGLVFTEDVALDANAAALVGVEVEDYDLDFLAYDDQTFTALWQLDEPITDPDKLLLHLPGDGVESVATGAPLDGHWEEGVSTFPSGDGNAGTDFSFRFNVLPGDVNRDAAVNVQDIAPLRDALGSTAGESEYNRYADLTGAGVVNVQDIAPLRDALGTSLPDGEPEPPATTSTATTTSTSTGTTLNEARDAGSAMASRSSQPIAPEPRAPRAHASVPQANGAASPLAAPPAVDVLEELTPQRRADHAAAPPPAPVFRAPSAPIAAPTFPSAGVAGSPFARATGLGGLVGGIAMFDGDDEDDEQQAHDVLALLGRDAPERPTAHGGQDDRRGGDVPSRL